MADGSGAQSEFFFPHVKAQSRLRPGEIVVDLFAGGGGASHALETALARAVDIAINHNPWAIGMHAANHPYTRHMCEDVWEADPRKEVGARRVGWMHASPDCTHFSQAKGGQPRSRATRSLSWVVLRWAGAVRPRIISLENVKEILKWGPLIAKRDKATGRCIKLVRVRSYTKKRKAKYVTIEKIAARGERVPIDQQFLIPDKRHEGRTWRQFITAQRALGYEVEWKRLKACDFGAGTSRERLFMVARCDGEPIRWPEPTHGPGRALPYVTAADCIDWSIECPSIFTRKRELADATLRRIARGIKRYVLDSADPFIVGVGGRMGQTMERPVSEPAQTITAKADSCICVPTLVQCANASASGIADAGQPLGTVTAWPKGGSHAVAAPILAPLTHQGSDRINDPTEPLRTITGANRGEIAVAAPVLVQAGYGERAGQAPRALDVEKPLGVVTAGGVKHAVASASLVKFRGDSNGGDVQEPLPTITSGAGASRPAGAAHAMGVISAHLATLRGDNTGSAATDPLRTLSAGGEHHALIEYTLSPEDEAGALRVAAFLLRYYGEGGQWGELRDPAQTITTKDRLALVTVTIKGTPYVIVDIGLRMLQRHELFRAQGFPASYIIDRTADGRVLSTSRSVAMVGNSVSPPPLRAIAIANLDPAHEAERLAA